MAKAPTTTVVPVNDAGEDIVEYINRKVEGIGNMVPTSWDDLLVSEDGEILEAIEFEGSPWIVVDKSKLVGVPFRIADVRAWTSDKFGRDAIAVMLMTKNPLMMDSGEPYKHNRYVINDGSTGVFEQVTGMVKRIGRKRGIDCPNGLRASEYDYVEKDFDGNPIPGKPVVKATTYYVA